MLRAIVLGIVQGITEFLPISSSAHLSIVPRLLGYATPTLAFEVLLHFGTLAAVAAYFARDLWAFVLCLVAPGRLGPQETATRRRLLGLLVLASVPAAVVGFLLQDWADEQTARPLRASVWLVLTTAIMIAAELVAGTLAASVSGFLAVSFLIRLLRTRTLWPFIWYRLAAGALFVLLLSTVRS